jgi:hypothetical protein
MAMFASTASPGPTMPAPHRVVSHPPTGLPAAWVISALVPPVLLGILVSRLLADAMTQAGLVSEQFYRGERLPTLNMPATETPTE